MRRAHGFWPHSLLQLALLSLDRLYGSYKASEDGLRLTETACGVVIGVVQPVCVIIPRRKCDIVLEQKLGAERVHFNVAIAGVSNAMSHDSAFGKCTFRGPCSP